MDNKGLEKILIIKPSSLGDIIHALPVAAAIKDALPGTEIDWVVGAGFEGILEGNPSLARVIVFERHFHKKKGGLGLLKEFAARLRREEYGAVIDLQGLLRSGLITFLSRSPRKVGFANAREGAPFFYGEKVEVKDPAIHAVDRYLLAVRRLGITPGRPRFEIALSEKNISEAESVLAEAGIGRDEPFAAIAPSARWETKRWPAGRFLEISGRLLKETGLKSIFVGSGSDAGLFRAEGAGAKNAAFGKTSLKCLAALLKGARFLLTNDSGPMHIAAAVGTPAAALFGPTDPARTGPYGEGHLILRTGVDCSPCLKRDCADVKCLAELNVDAVFRAIKSRFGL